MTAGQEAPRKIPAFEKFPQRPDRIAVEDSHFVGTASFLEHDATGYEAVNIPFRAPLTRSALTPFRYNKPPNTVEFGKRPPEDQFDPGQLREGNIPLMVVQQVMRGPNHLYEPDNGIVTAVNTAGAGEPENWETRYYPSNCLTSETWNEAMDILGIDQRSPLRTR